MPILTKNETPAKGQKAEFQLDKAALAAVTSVAADSYFSDSTNWKSVDMIFKSDLGKQRRLVKFDATQAIPISSFYASAKARDIFEIEKITINDFDGDSFVVLRGELTTSEFDIDMTPAVPYRYYKVSAKNSLYTQNNELIGVFSISEFRLKWDGVSQLMTPYSITQIIPANFDLETISVIKDGNLDFLTSWREPTGPYPAGGLATSYVDLFKVDLVTPRQVTAILFAPQGYTPVENPEGVAIQVPNEFKVYASNDNNTWTEVFAYDDPNSFNAWTLNQFREFPF
jgi:hypothetical protein